MSNVKKYKTFLLSKKKWHVGLPENIAKVKKDEEEYRIKQEEDKKRNVFKASEQRMEILKKRNDDDDDNSDLPVVADTSNSEKVYTASSDAHTSTSKVQQETFKNVQNVPWYCKIDGKEVVAREMRVSYHGILLESKQQIVPINQNSSPSISSAPNSKIVSFGSSQKIIDGSEYLSSLSQSKKPKDNLNLGEKLVINKDLKEKKDEIVFDNKTEKKKILSVNGNLKLKSNDTIESTQFKGKEEEEEEIADQNLVLPPSFHMHDKKEDESDTSDSDSSSSSSSSSSSNTSSSSEHDLKKRKRKRGKAKEKKKERKEKEKERKKRKRKKK